jgi:calcineurin-like phosphoesterase family protein
VIGKKDKLFILGDAAFSNKALPLIGEINGTKELIIGNHDGLTTKAYLEYFTKVHGFRQYKGFWLSHAPIHPQEIYRCRGNIHGHIHNGAATPPLPYPYYNVNVDFNKMQPVNFDTIEAWFKEKCDE